jgi:hypothetical protein
VRDIIWRVWWVGGPPSASTIAALQVRTCNTVAPLSKTHSVFDEGDSRSNFNRERSEEQTQAVIDL